jgi:proteasome lid subunit RPN8/RPN11
VSTGGVRLAAAAQAEIRRLAADAYPNEGCGVLIGRFGTATVTVLEATAGHNIVTERRRDRYELDPADILAAERSARQRGLDVVGFWHSHPDHPARASRTDSEKARGIGWPGYAYLIVSSGEGGTGDLNAFSLDAASAGLEAIPMEAEGE